MQDHEQPTAPTAPCGCPDFRPDSEYHYAQHLTDEHGEPDLQNAMDAHDDENPR